MLLQTKLLFRYGLEIIVKRIPYYIIPELMINKMPLSEVRKSLLVFSEYKSILKYK